MTSIDKGGIAWPIEPFRGPAADALSRASELASRLSVVIAERNAQGPQEMARLLVEVPRLPVEAQKAFFAQAAGASAGRPTEWARVARERIEGAYPQSSGQRRELGRALGLLEGDEKGAQGPRVLEAKVRTALAKFGAFGSPALSASPVDTLERAQGFGPFAGPAGPRSSVLASSTPLSSPTYRVGDLLIASSSDVPVGSIEPGHPEAASSPAAGEGETPEGEAPLTLTPEMIGTGLTGMPPQGFWNVGAVGAGMDPSIFNGKEYGRSSGDAVNRLIGNATSVREIDRAELLAAIRDMGVPLEMVDPNQVGAALNFINKGASGAIEEFGRGAPQTVDEQRERLTLALRQFRYLAEHGPAQMDRSLAINVMWSAARIPGHAFEKMSDAEVLAMAQQVAAACNTPGNHEFKVGRHTVKLTIGEDNTVLMTETKPPSAWETVVSRVGSAFHGIVSDSKNIALGVFKDLFEAAQTFAGGVWDLARGRLGSGLKGIGLGLLKVGLTGLDAGALAGLSGLSFVQTVLGLEPVGRKLSAEEISVLRPIFGDSVDYGRVRIKTEGFKGVFSPLSKNGFTRGDTIYFRAGADDMGLLIHEMTHVWQYQHGGNDLASEDIWAVTFGEGYRYENALARGLRWRDLNPEQQAQFLQDAYDPALETIPRRFVHSYNGVDYDYTAVLEEALRDLRAGRGAP